jgi:class 3 adenylate cyclase
MPKFPIIRLRGAPGRPALPELSSATVSIALEGISVGVDNLRHDVLLSPRFVEAARAHIGRLIRRHGELEGVVAAEAPQPSVEGPAWMRKQAGKPVAARPKNDPADWKSALTELHVAALNRAKKEKNLSLDLLARLAITKFLREEMNQQFAQLVEKCRVLLRSFDSGGHHQAHAYRERLSAFQVQKKIILRKAGQEVFETLREVEKSVLARTRRSLFGEEMGERSLTYALFLNRLMFSEDGRDDYLCAEHYVMLGNWARDPDRYSRMHAIISGYLRALYGEEIGGDTLDLWMGVSENALLLVGTGTPENTEEGIAQQQRLALLVRLLEDEQVIENVIASYHVVPLLAEYAPRINPQQLKNALVDRAECGRVERLIQESRLSPNGLYAALARVASCRGPESAKIAARFLGDFFLYHRDLRRFEALNAALDSVNLMGSERLEELSRVNETLYEFLLPEEQKQAESERVSRHVVLKADVRDSTRLTRTMMEQGLNPASYFSLNFYDPVNKLLEKYNAQKVFLEGDAIILAILERAGENGLAVSRMCVLAREIIEIVRGYNQLMQRSSLPQLELGIGIALQESAPLYLMDGDRQIMISEALNESDRLSSCNKQVRKVMEPLAGPFRVYAFQALEPQTGGNPEDVILSFNLSGVRMNEAAFRRLRQEITLEPTAIRPASSVSDKGEYRLFSAMVPVDREIFRSIVVRESRIPRIDPADFSIQGWTGRSYYEVCTDPEVYAALEKRKGTGA